jgi:hypothetical protein
MKVICFNGLNYAHLMLFPCCVRYLHITFIPTLILSFLMPVPSNQAVTFSISYPNLSPPPTQPHLFPLFRHPNIIGWKVKAWSSPPALFPRHSFLPLLYVTMSPSAPCSRTAQVNVLPVIKGTKYRTFAEQRNSMEHSPSWEANRFSVKKFHAIYGILRFITAFARALHLSLSRAKTVQFMSPSQFLKIHFNIILSRNSDTTTAPCEVFPQHSVCLSVYLYVYLYVDNAAMYPSNAHC